MLSRTAANLFWLGRYVERMDYAARLVQVAQRMSSLSIGGTDTEWHSAIIAAGVEEAYLAKHGKADSPSAISFLSFDRDNPSSIMSCIETARRNARAVRTALTVDMWDAINGTWLEARAFTEADFQQANITQTLDWVKTRALLFSGASNGTMLRRDGYYFLQLGTNIERADNTARILDVKYNVLLPEHEAIGGVLDYYQWTSILRSVSALRNYHWVYNERIKPWNVAELLILREEMPRSLRACYDQIAHNLDLLSDEYVVRHGECHRLAGEMHARLRFGRIDAVFQAGLHEFLTEYIDQTHYLGNELQRFYLM